MHCFLQNLYFLAISGLGNLFVSISTLVRFYCSNGELWGWSGARVMKVFVILVVEVFLFSFKNSYFLASWGFLRLLVRIYMKFPIDSYP